MATDVTACISTLDRYFINDIFSRDVRVIVGDDDEAGAWFIDHKGMRLPIPSGFVSWWFTKFTISELRNIAKTGGKRV